MLGHARELGLAAAAGLGLWLVVLLLTWPDVAGLATSFPESTAFIDRYTERGEAPDWRPVPYAQISPYLREAVVVSEDIEFFQHDGFSAHEMRVAVRQAIARREAPRGASTITQQLAKNLWLSPSRNPMRKLKEAILTRQLEAALEKRRILELYLNVVEFGPGVYGAEAAARRYFGRPAAALTSREAAQLAAGLPRPRTWHPGVESTAYLRRVDRIEARMREVTFLDARLGLPGPPTGP